MLQCSPEDFLGDVFGLLDVTDQAQGQPLNPAQMPEKFLLADRPMDSSHAYLEYPRSRSCDQRGKKRFEAGMIGPAAKDAIPTLEKLAEHEDPQIAARAKAALRQVRGR